jgi:hypothetical protein
VAQQHALLAATKSTAKQQLARDHPTARLALEKAQVHSPCHSILPDEHEYIPSSLIMAWHDYTRKSAYGS